MFRSLREWLPDIGRGWLVVIVGLLCGTIGVLQELSRSGVLFASVLVQTPIPTWGWYLSSVVGVMGGSFWAFHRVRQERDRCKATIETLGKDKVIWDRDARELAGLRDSIGVGEGRIQELEARLTNLPRPRLDGYDGGPPPRVKIVNDGGRGTFEAQCIIVGGNTGEKGKHILTRWEPGNLEGPVEIPGSHERWLRILREQIAADVPFRNVTVIPTSDLYVSSTGGSMQVPPDPWIELEINVSSEGDPLVERFSWTRGRGFRQ